MKLPKEILSVIEYDFDIKNITKWKKSNISDIINITKFNKMDKSKLFIGISGKYVFVLFSYKINNIFYNLDEYKLEEDDFGYSWVRKVTLGTSFKKIMQKIGRFNGEVYTIEAEQYELKPIKIRKISQINNKLKNSTKEFKEKLKEKIKISNRILGSGLSEIDEKILSFEDKYTKEKGEYTTIENLIDEYGIEKTIDMFMKFIKTNESSIILNYKQFEAKYWGTVAGGVLPICEKTKRILMPFRSAHVFEPNTWGVWGGKIDFEDGESENDIEDVVKREFSEETEYDGEIQLIPAYVYKDGNFKYYNYIGIVENEFEPELNWETEYSEWLTLEEVLKLDRKHFGLVELLEDEKSIKIIKKIIYGDENFKI